MGSLNSDWLAVELSEIEKEIESWSRGIRQSFELLQSEGGSKVATEAAIPMATSIADNHSPL